MTSLTDESKGLKIVAGEYYALRQFFLRRGLLTGINYAQVILPGRNKATCHAINSKSGNNHTPDIDCSCGWYSFKNNELWAPSDHPDIVTAVVKLSGKVIINEKGYRAEHMEIVARTRSDSEELFLEQNPKSNKNHDSIYDLPVYSKNTSLLKNHPVSDTPEPTQNITNSISIALSLNIVVSCVFISVIHGVMPVVMLVGFLIFWLSKIFGSIKALPKKAEIGLYILSTIAIIPIFLTMHPVWCISIAIASFFIGWLHYANFEYDRGLNVATSMAPVFGYYFFSIKNASDMKKHRELFEKATNVYGFIDFHMWSRLEAYEEKYAKLISF